MIQKTLSANDIGATGAHQAGILIPKRPSVRTYFPDLPAGVKNPRVEMVFLDPEDCMWSFHFIYYNGKRFGGTRDEFRLTGMTAFLRHHAARVGDEICFFFDSCGTRRVKIRRQTDPSPSPVPVLYLSKAWKVIPNI